MMPPVLVGFASADRLAESAQHVEVSVGEAEAGAPRLTDDRACAECLPRAHLLRPSVGALATDADAAFQRQPGGIAPRLARVLVHTLDDGPAARVGRQVRAPAVGEPRDAPQRRLGRRRLTAGAPDTEPDRDRPLDRHRIEPGVADPMELTV